MSAERYVDLGELLGPARRRRPDGKRLHGQLAEGVQRRLDRLFSILRRLLPDMIDKQNGLGSHLDFQLQSELFLDRV
jgi:hypothetical protein